MRKIFYVILLVLIFSSPKLLIAREGFSVGLQGMGNFFLTDSIPNLNSGPGGGIYFDYRFNQHWSIETDLFVSFHDGTGISEGDDGALFLGVPTVELKFYPRSHEGRIDPYILAGLGIYVLTEGDIDNNSGGIGVGGNLGVGTDFYIIDHLSIGIAVKFRPVALLQGGSTSTALINLGVLANIAWHF